MSAAVMATAKATTTSLSATQPKGRLAQPLLTSALAVALSSLTGSAIASPSACRAEFLFPTRDDEFFLLDTVNVTYRSSFSRSTLSLWCGAPEGATEKFRADNASPSSASTLVLLNFTSSEPCWFHLASDSNACRHGTTSDPFRLLPTQRSLGDGSPVIVGRSPTSDTTTPSGSVAATAAAASSPPPSSPAATAVQTPAPQPSPGGEVHLSPGALAAIGIAVGIIFVALGAMAGLFNLRRRRKNQDAQAANEIVAHERRNGRQGAETATVRAPSVRSGHSEEPLYPIADGFPGSTGFDDVWSMHSTNTSSHSPTGTSPTLSHNGGFWNYDRTPSQRTIPYERTPYERSAYERSTERDELSAARLKSKSQTAIPIVTSYGPNPVTPTLTPRPSSRVDLNVRAGSVSLDGRDSAPPVPPIPLMPDYSMYSIPPPAPVHTPPRSEQSPPRTTVPIVVSYGPNKVTPTPLVTSPTVPPDEAIVSRRFMEVAAVAAIPTHHERQFSWEADSPIMGPHNMGPLPPYASENDYRAMEKGAVRKLAEPQAQAELPPTKDGFYHYTSDIVEYELPGAAPQNEPQLPFRPYQTGHQPPHGQAGPSAGAPGGGRFREIDEQKFLLSDVEIAKLRAEKAKIRAEMLKKAAAPPRIEEFSDSLDPLAAGLTVGR